MYGKTTVSCVCMRRGIPAAQNEARDLEKRPEKRPTKETKKRDLQTIAE